jgi:hypothetical protein
LTAPSNPNPQPQVETPPPNPNPQPQVETPPPPQAPKANNFDPDSFFTKLDTQLKGFGEQMVTSIKEAFPAPEPPSPPNPNPPPKSVETPPNKETPPKAPEPGGGHLSGHDRFLNWWFGPGKRQ